jgi:hypothetical protein
MSESARQSAEAQTQHLVLLTQSEFISKIFDVISAQGQAQAVAILQLKEQAQAQGRAQALRFCNSRNKQKPKPLQFRNKVIISHRC